MTTALDLIKGAARLAGITFKSESLSADEAVDALSALNDMIASWGNNGLLVYTRTSESFSLSAGSSFSVGTGQTINTDPPGKIIAAFMRSGTVDYPMQEITDEKYFNIDFKSITSPFPDYFTYDNGHPIGTLKFYPELGTSAQFHMLSEKPIGSFAALTTTVDLPNGWNRAIRYNLAIEMAPEYGVEVPPAVARIANESMRNIMMATAKERPIKAKKFPARVRNIYSGYY